MPSRDFLERRNALWARLRALTPGTPGFDAAGFEETLADLAALTGWSRERVLAGLGLTPAEVPPPGERP
ncbi:hypothetical protein DEIPH_ctg023orf0002 [Deinococcus phoenicis]|uniref:Uncharacterized protein n=1 Tax=Deinococcus phoenicis TaxID=1476583 RepID=A0A016QQR1_9DEIO|nr:hypothetical protein [Deinococcus phoenicis]EYB68423.1 hypothetical protein DEIPH_ctg023orf0002 [Deinococcus phoenicis]